MIRSIDCMHWE
ncbi:hypothetical protein LINGRAHAP2_LOCUS19524 [Linum grandiflorum]